MTNGYDNWGITVETNGGVKWIILKLRGWTIKIYVGRGVTQANRDVGMFNESNWVPNVKLDSTHLDLRTHSLVERVNPEASHL